MPVRVAVVGDALLDVAIAPEEPMRRGGDVRATVRVGPGGQGANVAVRLARRGVEVRLACALGDDAAGRLLRDALRAEGVAVIATPVAASGSVAVLLDGPERTMLSHRVAFLDGVDVDDLARHADWLVVSGYALLEAGGPAFAARGAAVDARRAVLGCDVPAAQVDGWLATVSGLRADVVFVNEAESAALPGLRRAVGGALLVVTRPDAVEATGSGQGTTVSAEAPNRAAVDTTGAGDAFAAAVLAELGSEWPADDGRLRAALAGGLAAARKVVAVAGAQGHVDGERVGPT